MTTIKPDEISSIIRSKIENYELKTEVANTGSAIVVGDGIARIYGLRNFTSSLAITLRSPQTQVP